MPRDGSGNYTYPPGTPGIPDTTIESAKYNGYIADIQQDLNLPRPIVAGGTGSNTALGARDNLDAERAMATVTNYDTHVWESGSFWSAAGATAAPGADIYSGIAYVTNNDLANITVEARALNTGILYIRRKVGGVWLNSGAWSVDGDDRYVNVAGDTMTGTLTINSNALINGTTTTGVAVITGAASVGGNMSITGNTSTGATTINGALTCASTAVISHSGVAGVNNTNGVVLAPGFSVFESDGVAGAGVFVVNKIGANGTAIFFEQGTTTVGSITVANAVSTAYNTSSDERLKEDMKSFDASSIIENTNVYDFKWKAVDERAYGVIAQQAVDIYPTAVTYDEKNDWWGVDYSKYVPVILQELKALRARVAELEGGLEGKPA